MRSPIVSSGIWAGALRILPTAWGVSLPGLRCIAAWYSRTSTATEIWWNHSPQENPARHWLQLRLTGRRSNRSAIGAEVHCRAGGRTQVRTVSGSMGYASSSDLTVHFGLAETIRVAIEIRWPSGRVQALGEVAADQRLAVVEPTD
jgi:hypothetical protein